MRLLIGITTLSQQNQGSNKHIRNEIKMQQTRKIRIEEIRTEKSRIENHMVDKWCLAVRSGTIFFYSFIDMLVYGAIL